MAHSDPTSLADLPEPKVELNPPLLNFDGFNHCILLPRSLKWLLPKSVVHFVHLGQIHGSLSNEHNRSDTKPILGLYETEEPKKFSSNYSVEFNIWKVEDTIIILIDENEIKYPTILTNFLTKSLASLIKHIPDIVVLINSDRVSELKKLKDLVPPEFVAGSISNLIINLPDEKLNVLVVPSEGPVGFEKYNINTVDGLLDEMSQLLCSYPAQTSFYIHESMKLWKLDGCTSTQGGLYL